MERDVTTRTGGRLRLLSIGAGAVLVITLLAGCGSDDEESAQDTYCAAGDDLESSVTALTDLDLIAEGTNGLESALGEVESDVNNLRDTASEAAADEVSALEQATEDLGSAIEGLVGEITGDNVSALATAVQSLGSSAQAVYDTLSDCP